MNISDLRPKLNDFERNLLLAIDSLHRGISLGVNTARETLTPEEATHLDKTIADLEPPFVEFVGVFRQSAFPKLSDDEREFLECGVFTVKFKNDE